MGDVRRFPTDRNAALRVDFCDPGPSDDLDKAVRGKVPPHNLDAEACALSAIFGLSMKRELLAQHAHKPDLAAVMRAGIDAVLRAIETLKPEHFYSMANGRIFQAMQHLAMQEAPIDMHTVVAWLAQQGWLEKVGGGSYVEQIARHTPDTGHATAHAQLVIDAWEQRKFIETARLRIEETYHGCADWQARKAELRAEFGRLTAPPSVLVGRAIGAVVEDARAQVREATSGRVVGVRYPWPAVENLVGILARGQQTILAGLSEHGKTAAMMQIACDVASRPVDAFGYGEAVYVLSGEMPGPILLLRTACSFAGVDASRVLAGHANADELAAVQREFDQLERLPIVIDDKPAPAAEVAHRVRAHKAAFAAGRARMAPKPGEVAGALYPKCRLQLAIGDHAQDLAACEAGREEKDRIRACADGWLTHIAKGCDVATLLLSQLKMPEQKGPRPKFPPWPQVEHLFGAPNALKRSADTVIAVQRPELLMGGKIPAKWLGVIGVCRLKGRFGGDGRRVLLGYDRGVLTNELPPAARGEAWTDDDET